MPYDEIKYQVIIRTPEADYQTRLHLLNCYYYSWKYLTYSVQLLLLLLRPEVPLIKIILIKNRFDKAHMRCIFHFFTRLMIFGFGPYWFSAAFFFVCPLVVLKAKTSAEVWWGQSHVTPVSLLRIRVIYVRVWERLWCNFVLVDCFF